jgi:hypothetical protein
MTPGLFHESAALFLAAMAISRRLVLRMAFDEIYPNLFVLWLAATTLYRKTTGMNIARKLARDVLPFLLTAQDTTTEAFLADMAGQPPANYNSLPLLEQQSWEKERNYSAQRGWTLDELSGLMAGAGKDYNAGLMESLLRFYDNDPHYTRSTMGKGRIVVKNAYLSMLGASTPSAMAQHLSAPALWSNGWWARFAILTPAERPEWKESEEVQRPESLERDLRRLFERLPHSHKWPDPPDALEVTLAPDVQAIWSRYNKALSHDLLTEDLPEQLHGTYGRLPTQALKVAMILSALDWDNQPAPRIEISHISRAIEITESWRESAHRAIVTASEAETGRTFQRITRLVAKYEGEKGATLRDIYKAMKDKKPSEVEFAIQDMLRVGLLEEVVEERKTAGRPAALRVRLPRDKEL